MGLFEKKKKTSTTKKTTAVKKPRYGIYNARIKIDHKTGDTELLAIRKAPKPRTK